MIGRVGRDFDWKGRRLEGMEGTPVGMVVNWKGWKERQLEGLDPYVVDERGLDPTSIGRV